MKLVHIDSATGVAILLALRMLRGLVVYGAHKTCGQVSEAAKQISTLKAREDEQKKRRRLAEEEAEKIRKVRARATKRRGITTLCR